MLLLVTLFPHPVQLPEETDAMTGQWAIITCGSTGYQAGKTAYALCQEEKVATVSSYTPTISVTNEEFNMIAAVVMHEVGHCSRESKIAVTNVILNRVKDGRFGNGIYEVLHQRNQFAAISNYYNPTLPPDDACREAVAAALRGEDNSNGAVYYCNPRYIYDEGVRAWFFSLEKVLELDGQIFYKG